ncbi:hypothetical protein HK103_003821 [Boothiomyces macroporosus]|uniref:Uncharacterized protein n=1 Tax=Boothiomyces macroporosus TaxID=261099 RepID=A0AAD5UR17_9FUNG|nr:hypothetical protein HK103_003821 [Boothiomyces macroporosus]
MASKKRKDDQDLDDLVAAIEKYNNVDIVRIFNIEHRLPEIHSEKCAGVVKKNAQTGAKNDAKLLSSLIEKDPKFGHGNVKGKLEKERQDAKKRLREKIKSARK